MLSKDRLKQASEEKLTMLVGSARVNIWKYTQIASI